MAQRRQPSLLS